MTPAPMTRIRRGCCDIMVVLTFLRGEGRFLVRCPLVAHSIGPLTSYLNDVNILLEKSIPCYLNNVKIWISQIHHSEEESMTIADPTRPYHHGYLRRALLDAALHVLTEQGLAGLTLRAVARRAGVSEAAPYHHFASKAALVEALVVETLQQLAQALQEAVQASTGTPLDRLVATGVAYVRFALDHRASFQILYRPELRHLSSPTSDSDGIARSPIDQAGMAAYQVLLDGVVGAEIVPDGVLPDAPHLAHIVTTTLALGLVVRQAPSDE